VSDSFDPRRPVGPSNPQASLFGEAGLPGYAPLPGSISFDEAIDTQGKVREHWQQLLAHLAPLGVSDMAQRGEESSRLLRQNDVTYRIYDDPQSGERIWPLDIVPLVIPAAEWATIEAGVAQRARLLNLLLDDIYGAQRIITEGLLPPAALAANPGFLRSCHGLKPQGGIYLHLSAVDLARGPDGQWRVIADRTEAPSGAGYALENRSVVSRVLADCISDQKIAPLAPFFTALHEGLAELASPSRKDNGAPRIVLLTPGPYNETFFEHLFLAGHLGITLVEGADLTVRDRRVYIKTVSALEPVDVILRRVDDSFCDPLELRHDSALGVAGLLESIRAGHVVVANAPGAGVLQAMVFKPFLPVLSRALLGEELLLPDLASWWCGGDSECAHVLANLDRLVIKPAFSTLNSQPVFPAELSPGAREAFAKRINDNRLAYVGQERLSLSQAPIWNQDHLEPRSISLRVYVAHGPDGFVVMPGGLTRSSRAGGPPIVSMQSGGGSKDTWVLSDQVSVVTRRGGGSNVIELPEAATRRAALEQLPSRAADSLYWMGRYAERTDGAVRLLRTLVTGLTDPARGWTPQDAEPLVNFAAWLFLLPLPEDQDILPSVILKQVQKAISGTDNPVGIRAMLGQLTIAARHVRDRLPIDCWRAVSAFGWQAGSAEMRPTPVQIVLRLDELVMLGASLTGAIDESMPRNDGWRFYEIGKRLERAMHLVSMVRHMSGDIATLGEPERRVSEGRHLRAIVALAGARVVPAVSGRLDRRRVLEAVLAQEDDPRSLSYQFNMLSYHLFALPQSEGEAGSPQSQVNKARDLADQAHALVGASITAASKACVVRPLGDDEIDMQDTMRHAFDEIDRILPEISDLLTQAYFTHALARQA